MRLGVLTILVGLCFGATAQNIEKINCLTPRQLNLTNLSEEEVTKKQVFYQEHNDHTFWFKVPVPQNGLLAYSFEAYDEVANYDFFLYQYEGGQFCKAMVRNDLDLLSFNPRVKFKVKKGQVYYVGIYPHSSRNCGFNLSFNFNDKEILYEVINEGKDCDRSKLDAGDLAGEEKEPEYQFNSKIEVSGKVFDKVTGKEIPASLWLEDPFLKHTTTCISKPGEGYSVELEDEGDYKLSIHAFGYKKVVTILSAYRNGNYEYHLQPDGKDVFTLNQIYFYPNTYALKPESKPELAHLEAYMKSYPSSNIEVSGHTNGNKDIKKSKLTAQSGPEWNFTGTSKELSQRRAEMIKAYLEDNGVQGNRVMAVGKGGDKMVVKNPVSMKEAMKNIRVEVQLLKP